MMNILNSEEDDDEINVYIGDENVDEALKDFSVITFKHKEQGRDLGTIAIIGPTRMDYSKVISAMRYISKQLNEENNLKLIDGEKENQNDEDWIIKLNYKYNQYLWKEETKWNKIMKI